MYHTQVKETAAWIAKRQPSHPTTAIVLGTGRGRLLD